MKELKLSMWKGSKYAGMVALVDDEDYDYLNQWKWTIDKRDDIYYARRCQIINNKNVKIYLHRFILGVNDSKILVDHANRNGLDNRKANLRKCNRSQNATNRKSKTNSTSKYLGVSLDKRHNKWQAGIYINGKRKYLGNFISESDAAKKYNEAARVYHKEFANLNQI